MFTLAPPTIREATLFTRLPDRFREARVTPWSAANRAGLPLDSFLEAPVFDGQGNLYVSDIPNGRIFRIGPKGEWELVVQYEGEPNGMKFASEGEIIVADYRNGLMALDVKRGTVRGFLERRNTERFKGVNDLVFDSRGNLYFTDQGQTGLHDPTGRVYRLGANGRLELLLGNVPSPNGLALSPEAKGTLRGRDARQLRLARAADGGWQHCEGRAVLHVAWPERTGWVGRRRSRAAVDRQPGLGRCMGS